jgi:3-oxoacyl-[acyl-carrier protein] reductase
VSNAVTFDYSGAEVLVTGGTSGIGHALATSFADAGATVAVTGTKSDASQYGTDLDRFTYLRCEMTDPSTVDAVATALDGLDILVNNAGANLPGGRDEWEPEVFATCWPQARSTVVGS